jgi:hypothetical protein
MIATDETDRGREGEIEREIIKLTSHQPTNKQDTRQLTKF